MNFIILYFITALLIITVLAIGVLLNNQARACFSAHKNETHSKGLLAKDFTEQLFKHNKLRNISIINLRARKTNYYSAKYNVIKVLPEVANSHYLFDLAICAKCTNRATKQQYNYISSTLTLITTIFAKIVSMLFIPTILISAILNIGFELEKVSYIISLVSIICYLSVFIIQFVLYFIEQSSVKKIVSNIQKTNLLDKNELKTLEYLLIALNKFEFFDWTRLSLKIFTLLNPATILDRKQY